MDSLWIGSVKVNGASAEFGIGTTVISGVQALDKSNTGGCSVTGDYARIATGAAILSDADLLDNPLWAFFGRGG